MSEIPGMEWRVRAMTSSTLNPGSCPPSPGFAPWAILICISSAFTRYSAVTPKRPEATCLVLLHKEILSQVSWKRMASSPPSPVLLRVPSLFMAKANASCASLLIAPNEMAPVTKCLTIFSTGSTCSTGMGFLLNRKKSRRKIGLSLWSTRAVNSLNLA